MGSSGDEGLVDLRSRERFPSDTIDLRRDGELGSGDSCTDVAFLRVGVANSEPVSAEGVAGRNGIG